VLKSLFRSLTGTSPVAKIVFQNTGDTVPGIPLGILTMNPDGSELSKIRLYGSEPTWSPNGEWIAFSGLVDGYKPYAFNIHIMKPDGTDVRQITHHQTGGASSPSWSNDSTRIAYYVFEDGREHQIWIGDRKFTSLNRGCLSRDRSGCPLPFTKALRKQTAWSVCEDEH
jgi:Tol biopolymer transport system component